jgi:hypothetical protein
MRDGYTFALNSPCASLSVVRSSRLREDARRFVKIVIAIPAKVSDVATVPTMSVREAPKAIRAINGGKKHRAATTIN